VGTGRLAGWLAGRVGLFDHSLAFPPSFLPSKFEINVNSTSMCEIENKTPHSLLMWNGVF